MNNVRIGIAGLGRLGKRHALNIRNEIPGAILQCAMAHSEAGRDFARDSLGLSDCNIVTDYDELCARNDIDAIAIVTPSAMHPEHIEKALKAGKHVFCEKPLAITVEDCLKTQKIVDGYPNQIFMLGFMRRYDENYAYMKRMIDSGHIGKPYILKSTSLDPDSNALFYVNSGFIATSGGIFLDMASHDIDIMRWLLNDEPKTVRAVGTSVKYPGFKEQGDCENAFAMYEFKNGSIAQLHVGRCAIHGYHIETEVTGTEGSLRISPIPAKNQTLIYDKNGVSQQCIEGFVERFEKAYLDEMREFVDCVINLRRPSIGAADGVQAVKVAYATQEALATGDTITI